MNIVPFNNQLYKQNARRVKTDKEDNNNNNNDNSDNDN